jgi:nicotinamidase-related amidase
MDRLIQAVFMIDFPIAPERTALVNVDMQNCFIHGSPFSATDGLEVLNRINRVAAACRADEMIRKLTDHHPSAVALQTSVKQHDCLATTSVTDDAPE